LYRDAKMLDMADKSYRKALRPVHRSVTALPTAQQPVAYDQGSESTDARSWLRKAVSSIMAARPMDGSLSRRWRVKGILTRHDRSVCCP
jgi:hypothetical protein